MLGINVGAGFQVTDRLSVGATMTLGTGFEQLGFVGPIVQSAMVNAYALRGTVGFDYELNDCNTMGFYYQSKMSFTFRECRERRGITDLPQCQHRPAHDFRPGHRQPQPDGRQPAACRGRLLQAYGKTPLSGKTSW